MLLSYKHTSDWRWRTLAHFLQWDTKLQASLTIKTIWQSAHRCQSGLPSPQEEGEVVWKRQDPCRTPPTYPSPSPKKINHYCHFSFLFVFHSHWSTMVVGERGTRVWDVRGRETHKPFLPSSLPTQCKRNAPSKSQEWEQVPGLRWGPGTAAQEMSFHKTRGRGHVAKHQRQ